MELATIVNWVAKKEARKSMKDVFQYLPISAAGGKMFITDTITTAESVACGIQKSVLFRTRMPSSTNAEVKSPLSGDFTSVSELMALVARLPLTGIPPNTPFMRFVRPK